MKILHTADWHLGKIFAGRSFLEDQAYFMEKTLIPTITAEKPDCVVIAGDIFDRAIAPPEALRLFDEFLTHMAEMDVPLIAITGNHDGAERLRLGSRLMKKSGIHILTLASDCREPIMLTDADGLSAAVYPLPYFDLSEGKALLGIGESQGYSGVYRRTADSIELNTGADKNLLVSHCTVLGSERCDSESGVMVGGSSEVDKGCFKRFDAVLLGHLHSAQRAAKNVCYAGSPLRYSFDPGERDKSIGILELSAGETQYKTVPIKPLREMKSITGEFDRLMEQRELYSQDYIYFNLTDSQLIFEPLARLREHYPHTLGLRYAQSERTTGDDGRSELGRKLRERSLGDEEVFFAFMRQMCGLEPSEEQLELMKSLCEGAEEGGEAENET